MADELEVSVEEVTLDVEIGAGEVVAELEPDSLSFEVSEVIIDASGDATTIEIDVEPVTLQFEITASGPAGPPGTAEDEMVYAKRTDFVGDTVIYRGEATIGTADDAASWRIRRITLVGVEQDVVEEWAEGVGDFVHVWDDRATYTYS